jgi:hypothetical protein
MSVSKPKSPVNSMIYAGTAAPLVYYQLMDFRAYPVGNDGHLLPPTLIVSDNDAGAIEQVKAMLNGRPIELWEGSRLVGWFEKIGAEFVVVTSQSNRHAQHSEITLPETPAVARQQNTEKRSRILFRSASSLSLLVTRQA